MPIKDGIDTTSGKTYVQYGRAGAKYYYKPDSERSYTLAVNKAHKQAAAIHISQKKNVVPPSVKKEPSSVKVKVKKSKKE